MVDRYANRGLFRNSNNNLNRNSSCDCDLRSNLTRNNSNCNSGCNSGCNDNNSECRKLHQRLQTIDFSIIDTVLYLDAYPNCSEALCHYHKLINERKAIAEALAHKCDMPVTSFDNASEEYWNWTDDPWPWELSAN